MRAEQAGFIPSRHVQAAQTNFVSLEVDEEAFEQENQARMLRGDHGFAPRDAVVFQYAGVVFSIGFLHQCRGCKYKGPRKEFNATEDPPWKCPRCKTTAVYRTMESERKELPEIIANHGFRNCRVYPNKISPEGQILIPKDNSQQPIRLLRKVSRIDGATGEKQAVKRDFPCTFCGEGFLTLRMLQQHRVEAHSLGGGAVVPPKPSDQNGVTAAQAVKVLEQVAKQSAPKAAAAAAAATQPDPPEAASGAAQEPGITERKSPAEIKAMIAQAQKTKGGKASGSETE